MWFEDLTGFREETPAQVRSLLVHEGERITSQVNGRELICGRLETPALAELRSRVPPASAASGRLRISEVVADVKRLHQDPRNAGALFQVASQFNLLEMVSPSVTPECGVGIYANDPTQGPACAIAAGAGTIYRNYFVPLDGQLGQSAGRQLDCLADLGRALGNEHDRLWTMRNGYALASQSGLDEIDRRMAALDESGRDALREKLRIGLQWNTQVTLADASHRVSQAYCSALPVADSQIPAQHWAPFALLVLEAAYEATVIAGLLNASSGGSNRVYLTLLGGGAFGNREEWIAAALERAVRRFSDRDLDVAVVSHGTSRPVVRDLLSRLRPEQR